jgi:gliding motility-associated-like protein
MNRRRIGNFALAFLFLIVAKGWVLGEGTPQLRPNVGDSAMIKLINTVPGIISTSFARYKDTSATKYKMYVRVCNLSEKVYMGFNIGNDSKFRVSVIVISPDGTTAFPLTKIPSTAVPGYIASRAQAFAGPAPIAGAGGYSPFTFTPSQTGDYSVEFNIDTLPALGTSGGRGNTFIKYFDVTVANAANVAQPGRLWSTAWDISVRTSANSFNGAFYVYTADKIVSKVSMDKMVPQEFVFSGNNTGVQNTGNPVADRQSVKGNTTYPSYPIFLNEPDINCFPTGSFGVVNGKPTLSGCPGNYCINVNVTSQGNGTIYLDLDGTPGYQSGTSDRALIKNLVAGLNCIPWDGKDDLGNMVKDSSVTISFKYENGLTHIPMFDVERNPNGFTVTYVRPLPSNGQPIGLYWDDSKVAGTTMITVPCTGACHSWTGTGAGNIGDNNTINTWWVGADTSVPAAFLLKREVHANRNVKGLGKANDTSICASLKTVQLKGSSVGVSHVKWTILVGSGKIANDTVLVTTYAFSKADSLLPFVQLVLSSAGDGCAAVRDSIKFIINPLPNVGATPVNPLVCNGFSISLSGSGASAYVWDKGVIDKVAFVPTISQRYTVTGTDSKGCKDTASTFVSVVAKPNTNLSVQGDTVCSGSTVVPLVKIGGAQAGITYTARLGSYTGTQVGQATPTSSGTLNIAINRALLVAAPSNNTIYLTTTLLGCGTDTIHAKATIRINLNPDLSLPITGSTTCSNAATNPFIVVVGAQTGVTYEARKDSAKGVLLGSSTAATTGNLSIFLDRTKLALAPANNVVYVTASIKGCGVQTLSNTAIVRINTKPSQNLTVQGDTICSNGGNPTVKILAAEANVAYDARLGSFTGTVVGTATPTTSGVLVITVDKTKLAAAPSDNKIYFTTTILGCGTDTLTNKANIHINPSPSLTLPITGATICSNAVTNPFVVVVGAQMGVTYEARKDSAKGIFLGSATALTTGNLSILLDKTKLVLAPISNLIYVTASIKGCGVQTLSNTAIVKINLKPTQNLLVQGDTICSNSGNPTVKILAAEANVTYDARVGSFTGPIVGTGTPTTAGLLLINVDNTKLAAAPSDNKIYFTTTILGCGTDTLTNKVNIRINQLPSSGSIITATSPICAGGLIKVKIAPSQLGVTFTITVDGPPTTTILGTSLVDSTSMLMNVVGLHTIGAYADIKGCNTVLLSSTAKVQVDTNSNVNLPVKADSPICLGKTSVLTVSSSQTAVLYTVYEGNNLIAGPKSGTNADLTFDLVGLAEGTHTFRVQAVSSGCGATDLSQHPIVVVNPPPTDSKLVVIGDTVCSTTDSASVTLLYTSKGVKYQAILGGNPVGPDKTSVKDSSTLVLKIPVSALALGTNTVNFTGEIGGCGLVAFTKFCIVVKNKLPDSTNLVFIGDTICSNSDSAHITIQHTEVGVRYQAQLGGVLVGTAITSPAKDATIVLAIERAKLKLGSNPLEITGAIPGCTMVTFKGKTALVIVNSLPDSTLNVVGDTACSNSPFATVQIVGTKAGETYQAYENGNKIGVSILSQGNITTLSLPIGSGNGKLDPTQLLYTIRVYADIRGCLSVRLQKVATIVLHMQPDTNLKVRAISPICLGSNGEVVLLNSQKGVTYSLVDMPSTRQSKMGTDSSLVFSIPNPTVGLHTYFLQADIAGCATVNLKNNASILVNPPVDVRALVTATNPICFGDSVFVTINKADAISKYQVFEDQNPVSTQKMGNGSILVIGVPNLSVGVHALNVHAFTPGCGEQVLVDTAKVKVNRSPNRNLVVDGSSICPKEIGLVSIGNAEPGVIYTLSLNGGITPLTLVGNGGNDTLYIPSSYLSASINLATFTASIASCVAVPLLDSDTVFVLNGNGLSISGQGIYCQHKQGRYTTNGIPGALSYQWSVDPDAQIVGSNTSKQVLVQFNMLSTKINLFPVGDQGVCGTSGTSRDIYVAPPLSGQGRMHAKDTVCLNQIDTVWVQGISGATAYTWNWPKSVAVLDSFPSDSGRYHYIIKYVSAGFSPLSVLPYSDCDKTFGDVVLKTVRVFGPLYAEANEYKEQQLTGGTTTIPLNGTGSTLSGPISSPTDSVRYVWYIDKSAQGQITNPNSLMSATFMPISNETKVYLMLSQVHGYCPAKDSALIKVLFDIIVPNVFSPNNDGTHDTWEIKNIGLYYPQATVEIFNQWGSFIWKSNPGYSNPWDGTRNGEQMPVATYYYILDLKNGDKPKASSITIIR